MAIQSIPARRLAPLLRAVVTSGPAYRGLADGLRLLIADGQLPAGTRLPSERELAPTLGLSRTTVTRAYAALRESGFARSRQGSGTTAALPEGGGRRHRAPLTPSESPGAGPELDLTCAALPAVPGVAAAYQRAVEQLPAYLPGYGYHPLGLPELREALAARYTARGLPTGPDQVIITPGALAALAVACRAFLGAGDRVLMESPTYPNAIDTVRQAGGRTIATPLNGDGWDPEGLSATVAQTAPRAAYLMPDFQNPTGALMGEETRQQVGSALQRGHVLTIVDETLVDTGHDPAGAGVRPMAAFVPHSVTLGSSSKSHWGGLRVGWARAPRDLVDSFVQARMGLDLGSPVLEQLALLDLLDREEDLVELRARALRERRTAVVAALAEQLPGWRARPARGGLAVWAELPAAVSTALTVAAERHGVLLAPGPQFSVDGTLERYLRIPFTAPPAELDGAVRRIARAFDEVLHHPGTAPGRRRRFVA